MPHIRLAAGALAVLAISGCGGSSKPSTTTSAADRQSETNDQTSQTQGTPVAQAQLIASANAICKRVNARMNASSANTVPGILTVAPKLEAAERTALVELNKLVPPPSLASGLKQTIESIEILADNTAKLTVSAKSGYHAYAKAEKALVQSNLKTRAPLLAAASRAGFSECAQIL